MRLTVIPSDNIIIKDGQRLVFEFAAPAGLHAIQWHDTYGFVETSDGVQERTNNPAVIQPFIDAHAAEVARLAVIASTPPTLAEAKALRVAYLASEKERVENLPVTFNGHVFAAGSRGRKDIDRLLLAQANGAYVATTLYDDNGAAVTFTALTLKALHTAFANTAANAYANYWAKHALVQAATTIPAVEAIVW